MFFKKKNDEQELELETKPLNYWEEDSYMIIPLKNEISKDEIYERLSKINNIEIQGMAEPSDKKPGRIVFEYQGVDYEIGYYVDEYTMPELFEYQKKEFTEEELKQLYDCKNSITLFMNFTDNFKMEYKIQLLISYYITNNLICVLDESSEKLLHPNYVKMIINSSFLPSTDALFSIQAVVDKENVWLHTHGLCRCGFSEIEIINSNTNDYNNHYSLISTLANHIIDEGIREDNVYFVGYLNENTPLVVTLLPWVEGLQYYKDIDLGGPLDRRIEHNTNTSILFVFSSEQDIADKLISKVEIYNGQWNDDIVFFITNEETERMSLVAQERLNYALDLFDNKENTVVIKIGIETDNGKDREHMWFELIELLSDSKFKVKLISEPYNISSMHEGDILEFSKENITDWIVYTKDINITPDKVYLLDK